MSCTVEKLFIVSIDIDNMELGYDLNGGTFFVIVVGRWEEL